MGHQDPTQRCGKGQHFRILHAISDDTLRQLEIYIRFAAKYPGDNILIEIGIGEEADPQPLPRESLFACLA